ncbi:hypothetical protein BDZ89DRAFT_1164150 [Hymenopellis radicata]|nr:hypothetical protein BDZ89DRAFT_1164150 [Hymenopellis radicata]
MQLVLIVKISLIFAALVYAISAPVQDGIISARGDWEDCYDEGYDTGYEAGCSVAGGGGKREVYGSRMDKTYEKMFKLE